MEKKLYRSRADKKISGICGGLGKYLNIDPTLVRVLYVLASLFTTCFPGLIVYIVLSFVIPEEPEHLDSWQQPPQDDVQSPQE